MTFSLSWPVPPPPASIITSDFENHLRIAKQGGYCSSPKPKAKCPHGYYYPAIDLYTNPPIGCTVEAASDSISHVEVQDQCDTGYGLNVRINHAGGFYTIYAHLSKVLVVSGEDVKQGQPIGYTGWTGNVWDSSGHKSPSAAHLHFELRLNGVPVDPMPYLAGSVTTVSQIPLQPLSEFEGAVVLPLSDQEFSVVSEYVNLRSEPSTRQGSQTVVGKLDQGQKVVPSRLVLYEAWLDLGNEFCALVYHGTVYLVKKL